ncbi:MAG: ABC transporter substrate-binding protein [Eubacteriales bacterium]|nr:ABC transporter substrate-binding protein [Eubacteriales bacterium]MDY5016621.1 ABC transporter substrate-binding protein [Eubacteriales bacterium]
MKKLLSLILAAALALALTACSGASPNTQTSQSETTAAPAENEPSVITLATYNGAGEKVEADFPYNPRRVAVMDLAALDILDNIGCGDRIVGVSKGSSIDYLQDYVTNDALFNLGTIKEADMEALMECEPEVIIIGGRLSSVYDELAKIAPVFYLKTDTALGLVESTYSNAKELAAMFGAEAQVDALLSEYDSRMEALQAAAEGKTAIIGMVNAGGFSLLGNDGRCSIIGVEIGFENVGVDSDTSTSTHGNEASFEFVLDKNPDYIFAMDRDAAIGTEGAQLAAEVLDNELIGKTEASKNGRVVVLEHSNVWYTAEGGITALGIMLSDLEGALLG